MNIPCSSPFFTQPTQVVNRNTQPTQIISRPTQPVRQAGRTTQAVQASDDSTQPTQITGRTTLRSPSSLASPLRPGSPGAMVEVPASSPFQPKSQPDASSLVEKKVDEKKVVGSSVGSLMAPAGTSFKPPSGRPAQLGRSNPKMNTYLTISDDELSESYKHHDSSGDESPMRGDIKPSVFLKKDAAPRESTDTKLSWSGDSSLPLKNIHDLRLRHLTKDVFKIVSKIKPTITVAACRDALITSGVGWQVSKAVNLLLENSTVYPATNSIIPNAFTKMQQAASTKPAGNAIYSAGPTKLSQSQKDNSFTSNSTSHISNPNFSFDKNTQPPPRRRLVQGRKHRSPTPPPPVPRKRKAEEDIEPQAVEVLSDSEDGFAMTPHTAAKQPPHHAHVLGYINTCTAESLAQMTGFSAADVNAMISSRPFASIHEAEAVTKRESKSKAKAKRVQIGELFVEKLTSWFAAFIAASEVIKHCEERGNKLKKAMADWPMDKNGNPQEGNNTLPVSKKPRLMAKDISLKSYQLLGLNWMSLLHSKGLSGILADDMGLGKTCQVISLIAELVGSYKMQPRKVRPWPFLVVVPPSVCENWLAEFERFAPKLNVCPYLGKDRRGIDPDDARESHVILTSYSQVEKAKEDLRWLQAVRPYAAVFDEGHKLKNRNNLIYKQMMQVKTHWRLILSGTPVQNNLKELLTLLHFVEPDLFGDRIYYQLDTIFEAKVPNKEIHNFAALAKERVSNARAIMAPFILQRRKEDVLDLAKKVEFNIVVDMHPKQKAIYDEVKGRYLVPPKQRATSTIKDSHPWMQLRKAAIHHQLFRVHFTDEMVKEIVDILWEKCTEEELYVQSKADRHKALLLDNYINKSDFQLHLECKHFEKYIGHFDIPHRSWEESPKVQKLLELVRSYIKNGDRVLVFSRFDLVIDILRETLAYADIPYCELTGSTDISDRFPEIERFNENPDIPVFLLTTGAGGTGLNLTAANKIIIFDQSDNPQDDVQASNRAHRIGQTREVEVIRLLTRDTVEGLIFNSCVKKLMLARIVEGNIPVDDTTENESVEQQCRRLMLLEEEGAATQASQAK
ncbi:SNF2 family N-terminal domain-containing protein [Xylaria sp. CBS 124048]|nr:SNF2 family N-terminal domain-containing protein [Xylaria sp. CBS 124048]